jgi:hypothetical protein
MLRLLVLLVLCAAPLVALAHQAHHPSGEAQSAPAERAQPPASGPAVAAVAAASRCPGGDHQVCCCQELTCTPSFQPHAVSDALGRKLALALAAPQLAPRARQAPRPVALARYSPRGPPSYS